MTINGALRDIQELEHSLLGQTGAGATGEASTSVEEQLKQAQANMEEMKQAHTKEKADTRVKLSEAISKVKEHEAKQAAEIQDLTARLEKAQKSLQEASKDAAAAAAAAGGKQLEVGPSIPEGSLISFRELELDASYTLGGGGGGGGGGWGYPAAEAIFRGKRVSVREVSRTSLASHPIHTVHQQIRAMASLRHPNLLLFLGVAMDAPGGIAVLMEVLTCSLRQASESNLLQVSDKLPLLLDVALACNFLHLERKRPVVHNNLSSLSVLLEEGGEGHWRAKLADVGASVSLLAIPAPEGEGESLFGTRALSGAAPNHSPVSFSPAGRLQLRSAPLRSRERWHPARFPRGLAELRGGAEGKAFPDCRLGSVLPEL